jgi:Glycosyl hydrolase family 12/Cellulose binding domain
MQASLARLRAVIAAGAAATLLVASFAGAQVVQAATSTCSPTGTIAAGDYTIQANEWNSSTTQCITYTGGTAWSVTTANMNASTNGAPGTYPSIYKGCHWGACTANSGLPIQVSKLTAATMSWSTTQTYSGMYNVAADIWINSTPTTSGQPDGTELMIWENSQNAYPFGSQTATASLAGYNWDVWTGQQSSWKIITYKLNPGTTSFNNLDVLAIIKDAVTRGYINSAYYLIDAEAGNEIWTGGQGLGTTSFAFNASSGVSLPTPTPTVVPATPTPTSLATPTPTSLATPTPMPAPTSTPVRTASPTATAVRTASPSATAVRTSSATPPPAGGSASCTAVFAVSSAWGTGFTANVTVKAGSTAIKTWKVTWTWPGNQAITNSWSAAVTSSGATVTAVNMSYNGSLAAGSSTSFGFQASYSGTNGAPTLTCSAT